MDMAKYAAKMAPRIIRAIQAVLTPDLLQPKWRGNPNPLAGHCYVAAESAYYLLGGKNAGLKAYSAPCPGGVHWWLQQGSTIIDPTGTQFDDKLRANIYANGRARGFLTKEPSKRAQLVIYRMNCH